MRSIWVAALAVTLAVPATAGTIRGTVRFKASASAASSKGNAYPGRASSIPGGSKTTRGLVTDGVVHIESFPAEVDTAFARWPHPTPKLAQKDQAFVPRVLAVAAGATVQFPNLDPIYHNVFSLSPAKRFDLGKYPRGQSRTVKFTKPGLINVYCDIHSDMGGYILVLPHGGFVQPDANGAYAFPELPAGNYRVTFWHPDVPAATQAVEVPVSGPVTCDFAP